MPTVNESFSHCHQVARKRARNFYYAFVLLPREQRDAMCAIYAFMRYADDIGDDPVPAVEAKRQALSRWSTALEDALQGRYGADPILPAFHAAVSRYDIPSGYFRDLIRGVESDLSSVRYETFEELYQYCYRVASVVGMTCIHIFGYEQPAALKLAEKCGIAFQLTNILRDIPEDARQGRVYLPQEDLSRFGVAAESLAQSQGGEPFQRLMEFQCERAESYYRQAEPLVGMVRPRSRAALWAMIAIYHGILSRIRRAGYDVYTKRARLSWLEKGRIVMRAARTHWLGGALQYPV